MVSNPSFFRYLVLIVLVGLGCVGCTTPRLPIPTEQLLPPRVSLGVSVNFEDHNQVSTIILESGLFTEDPDFLQRIQRLYFARTNGTTLILVQGNVPGFVLEWILWSRYKFRLAPLDSGFEVQYPGHKVLVPGPRTELSFPPSFGILEDIVLLRPGLFVVRFASPQEVGDAEFPAPWVGKGSVRVYPDNVIIELVSAFDPDILGIKGVDFQVLDTGMDYESEVIWELELGFYQDAGNRVYTTAAQRGLGTILRLFSRDLIQRPYIPMNSDDLRRDFSILYDYWESYGYTWVGGLKVYPWGVNGLVNELSEIFQE